MSLFKRYKTIKEMIPGFLKEKEVAVQRKSFLPYINASKVLTAWLEDHGKADVPMKRITSQNMADFFLYLGKEKNLDKPSCEHFLLNYTLIRCYYFTQYYSFYQKLFLKGD